MTRDDFSRAVVADLPDGISIDHLAALMAVVSAFVEHWLQDWRANCRDQKPSVLIRFHTHRMRKFLRHQIAVDPALGTEHEWLADPLFALMVKQVKELGADADGLMAEWCGLEGGQS